MVRYLVRRLGQALVTVWLVTTIVFVMLQIMPGTGARVVLGERASLAEVAAFNRVNGLDQPWPVQYARFLAALLTRGQLTFATPRPQSPYDIVTGYAQGVSLGQLMAGPVLNTAIILVPALVIAVPVGMALGSWLAVARRPRWLLVAVGLVGQAGYALPVFVTGLIVVQLLGVDAGVLPLNTPEWPLGDVVSQPSGLVMPILTLVVGNVALFTRYFQASVADCLVADYVITARGKGASPWRILRRHVARNASIPVVTVLATRIPTILGIQIPLEVFFQYPGIGNLAWTAATGKLSYTFLGAVLIVGTLAVLSSLAADVVYLVLDPRIRYTRDGRRVA